jgi:glycosyltransferase involved in cell wall biosynthesis
MKFMEKELCLIIAFYNEEKSLPSCLNSIKKQSSKDFEVILVNDGSTDKSLKIVENFRKNTPEVPIKIFSQKNSGPGEAKNLAIKKTSSKYLLFMDSDEILPENYVAKIIRAFTLYNSPAFSISYKLFRPKNKWVKCQYSNPFLKYPQAKNNFRAIRRAVLLKLGGFDKKKGYADDQIDSLLDIKRLDSPFFYHDIDHTLKQVYKKGRWLGKTMKSAPLSKKFFFALTIPLIPLIVFPLAVKKCYLQKNFLLFPWMLIFIFVRSFGMAEGFRKK